MSIEYEQALENGDAQRLDDGTFMSAEVRPEAAELMQQLQVELSQKGVPSSMDFPTKSLALRWLQVHHWAMSFEIVSLKIYPKVKTKESVMTYYAKVKYWMQAHYLQLFEDDWDEMFIGLIHPSDLENCHGFEPTSLMRLDKEVYWTLFDAAVARWVEDLPSTGWPSKERYMNPTTMEQLRILSAIPQARDSFMKQVAEASAKYFFRYPYPWRLTEYIEDLKQIYDLGELLKDLPFKDLQNYVNHGTPLLHGDLVFETALRLAQVFTKKDWTYLNLVATPVKTKNAGPAEFRF